MRPVLSHEHVAAAVAPQILASAAELILDALPAFRPNSMILEVSAATGVLSSPLAERVAGLARVVCVEERSDLSAQIRGQAGRVARVIATADRLPFGPHTFDVALCNLSMLAGAEHSALLRALRAVMRPGGLLVETTMLGGSLEPLAQALTTFPALTDGERVQIARRPQLSRSARDVTRDTEAAGFRVERVGVEERAFFYADGAAAVRDPLVRNVLVPLVLDRTWAEGADVWGHVSKALDSQRQGGEIALPLRIAVVSARLSATV